MLGGSLAWIESVNTIPHPVEESGAMEAMLSAELSEGLTSGLIKVDQRLKLWASEYQNWRRSESQVARVGSRLMGAWANGPANTSDDGAPKHPCLARRYSAPPGTRLR